MLRSTDLALLAYECGNLDVLRLYEQYLSNLMETDHESPDSHDDVD